MFTDKQKTELAAPLSRANVKQRAQAGRQLSYVESWVAISEANRIFGFDGWSSETVEIKCVSERERKIGREPNTKDGWGVSYTAKVRVVAFAGDSLVIREGVGAGHGIDVDLGQAHESAIKEAESDSRKRALMTFGNPFGLALYDKEQANVAEPQDESKLRFIASCEQTLSKLDTAVAVDSWWTSKDLGDAIDLHGLTLEEVGGIKAKALARKKTLSTPVRMAG